MRIHWILISFLFLAANASAKSRTATLLYITDAHEVAPVVDRLGDRGGVARLMTVVEQVRHSEKEARLLFGGDLAGGVLFGAVFHGMPVIEALNRIGVDAAMFGQHDFDFGAAQTRRLVAASRFPWFTTNLTDSLGMPFDDLPRTVVVTSGGLRIGLIGLTDAMETTSPGSNVRQGDLLASARRGVEELSDSDVDAIVALTQTPLANNITLLDSLPQICAILSEERDETHSMVEYVGDRPIASPGGNLASMLRLNLTRDKEGGIRSSIQVYAIAPGVEENPTLKALSDRTMKALSDSLDVEVATLKAPLESAMYKGRDAHLQESMAGDLITDAYRTETKAEIAIIQGGGIRAALPAGPLTRRGLLSLLPFGNRVCVVRMSGSLLRTALEYGVGDLENHPSRVLQVSGVRYRYDPALPSGSRVIDVEFGGKPLDMEREYTVALPDYLLGGGDGYTLFSSSTVLIDKSNAQVDVQLLETACRARGTITPTLDGRIQRIIKNGE